MSGSGLLVQLRLLRHLSRSNRLTLLGNRKGGIWWKHHPKHLPRMMELHFQATPPMRSCSYEGQEGTLVHACLLLAGKLPIIMALHYASLGKPDFPQNSPFLSAFRSNLSNKSPSWLYPRSLS